MAQQRMFYEARATVGGFIWVVYHYDSSGNREVVVARSEQTLSSAEDALDDCVNWMDENNVDAELG